MKLEFSPSSPIRTVWLQLVVLKISIGFSFSLYSLYLVNLTNFSLRIFFFFMFSTFEAELGAVIPVVKTSIHGTRIIGRLCAGKTKTHSFFSFNYYLLKLG